MVWELRGYEEANYRRREIKREPGEVSKQEQAFFHKKNPDTPRQ
jgi:hypothetical protein